MIGCRFIVIPGSVCSAQRSLGLVIIFQGRPETRTASYGNPNVLPKPREAQLITSKRMRKQPSCKERNKSKGLDPKR